MIELKRFSILEDTGGEIVEPNHLSSLLDESNERSLPCVSTRLLGEPGMHAAEIERGGSERHAADGLWLGRDSGVP